MSSSEDEPELETLDISNDQYYKEVPNKTNPVAKEYSNLILELPRYGSKTIRHTVAAYDLWRPFFPTYLSAEKFRNFHRPKLRHYNTGPQAKPRYGRRRWLPVRSLSRNIYRFQKKLRSNVIQAIKNGVCRDEIANRILAIRSARGLTAKHGELFLFEYSEEFPPVLSQVGMVSNVKTYIRPNSSINGQKTRVQNNPKSTPSENSTSTDGHSDPPPQIGFVENLASQKHPIYFSQPKPGSKTLMIENNLYRAPIFEHNVPSQDFLVVRTRNNFYIRSVQTIFTVGQTMPLATVPPPDYSSISRFRLDLSNFHIHRLFQESRSDPPSLKLGEIMKLFPDYPETTLKKRIRASGCYSLDNLYVQGRSHYGKITKLELRKIMKPEQYCLNMASLAARQRLRELNYTESMINPSNDAELETEVLAAPWNTSKAVIKFTLAKCYLDLRRHLIDPTGSQREGFSCVVWSRSPTEDEQDKVLRGAPGKLLNNLGPTQTEFLDKNPFAQKIKREKLERLAVFQKEAQIIAETQLKVLSSHEAISSSEDEDDKDSENVLDESFDEHLNDLDRLVVGGRNATELSHEKEEDERRQMLINLKLNRSLDVHNNINSNGNSQIDLSTNLFNIDSLKDKILKITRTYDTPEGKTDRTEIVREPRIIDMYIKQKGGSLEACQQTQEDYQVSCGGSSLNNSMSSTKSDGAILHLRKRSSFTSLGPTELCRADGTILRISKKVLEKVRPMRKTRRSSMAK